MERKKVLILITKSNWGGAQRYVYDLATRLPKDKYEVEVMAGGNGPLIDKLKAASIPADGTLPIGRDVNFFQDTLAFFKLWNILRKKKPDILHINSSKIGGLGALAGRLAFVPKIVFTAHGWAFNENRTFASKLLIKLAYWVIIILSHRVMAVSEAAAKYVRHWPFASKKIEVVYNGIESISQFSQANARHALLELYPKLKEITSIGDRQLIWIGTIGELHHIKGHEYAIRAIAAALTNIQSKHPQKKLIYTIFGEGEERSKLESLLLELGLENNVFLLGQLPDAVQYIQAFDVFLMASLSEGLAYVILECGISHAAVVATGVGGIPEIIEDMHSGILVLPKKPAELAHAIEFMIGHPTDRKKYGTNLKEKVLKDFSLPKMIEKVESVYSN